MQGGVPDHLCYIKSTESDAPAVYLERGTPRSCCTLSNNNETAMLRMKLFPHLRACKHTLMTMRIVYVQCSSSASCAPMEGQGCDRCRVRDLWWMTMSAHIHNNIFLEILQKLRNYGRHSFRKSRSKSRLRTFLELLGLESRCFDVERDVLFVMPSSTYCRYFARHNRRYFGAPLFSILSLSSTRTAQQ